MCSDSVTKKYHRHYSTASTRRVRLQKGEGTYMCDICKKLESVTVPANETRRVVVADSTMYGIWGEVDLASTEHFDIDSIVGGKVKDMTRALLKNYLHLPNRLEILVFAGINNIGAGERAEEIIKDMKELKQVVEDHSKKWRHSPPSYVVFCTVILPPKDHPAPAPIGPPLPVLPRAAGK